MKLATWQIFPLSLKNNKSPDLAFACESIYNETSIGSHSAWKYFNSGELSIHLDEKYNKLKSSLGNIGENKLLLITTIKIIDDYFDLFKKVKNTKNDFEKLSIKFKELRSLAINYKEEKELEIQKLTNELNEFKKKAEESKDLYEEVLDKTTKSIEKFIESVEVKSETNIQ